MTFRGIFLDRTSVSTTWKRKKFERSWDLACYRLVMPLFYQMIHGRIPMETSDHSSEGSFERIDLTSAPDCGSDVRRGKGRPYLGILFRCCGIYLRIYLNRDGTAFEGRCPRCLRVVRIGVSPNGSDDRFFSAY
ncbi:MAG TPA: hypothetical protein PLO20_02430 [Thermogutta sp.]|nr:hypothetical protein [Thermogutta sp.]HQF13563.1 hypothetical protein [Thermogutta sp.]